MAVSDEKINVGFNVFGREDLREATRDLLGVRNAAQQLARADISKLTTGLREALEPFKRPTFETFSKSLEKALKVSSLTNLQRLRADLGALRNELSPETAKGLQGFRNSVEEAIKQSELAISEGRTKLVFETNRMRDELAQALRQAVAITPGTKAIFDPLIEKLGGKGLQGPLALSLRNAVHEAYTTAVGAVEEAAGRPGSQAAADLSRGFKELT